MDEKQKGSIGLYGAIAIGIGGMVGGGIFAVLGLAVSMAHGATPIAFALAGGIAILTAFSYAKLSVAFPSQGGTVVFLDRAFGHDSIVGGLNFILWLSYLVTLSLYATAFESYAKTFFPVSLYSVWLHHGLISIAIIIPVMINLLGAELISKSETFIVVVKLVLLGIVVASGAVYIQPARLAVSTWAPMSAVIPAGMVIFVAYEGFELISNAAEDVRNPSVTLPRAYYASVGIVVLLYILVAILTVGVVPESLIASSKDYVLAEAARPALGQFGFFLVGIAAMLATISAINATIYGSARLGFILAKDKDLPQIMERKVWDQPFGVLVVGAITLCMANTLNIESIAVIASAGFLLIFSAVNLAGAKLAKTINAKRLPMIIGAVVCFAVLCILLWRSAFDNREACIAFFVVLICAFLFEFAMAKFRSTSKRAWHCLR
ncbi:APC family permease [Maridesulfovibrio zosterae]|uniref:APC family permease n=1 Tax=Maridesulfovibrio zosterae TaxID=82171 RepID=UPI000413A602|nr:APC family permease [Maridesulfovibrio zosterae]